MGKSSDFNNDGFNDLVIGAPGEAPGTDPKSGFAFVFRGSATGLKASQGLDQKGLGANELGDLFGSALSIGDFNNDGFDDLAVGAPGEAPGTGPKSGFAFIYKGSTTGLRPLQGLDQKGLGINEADDRFGQTLAVGDFNRDGFDDLAVGAPGETPGTSAKSGFAFIYKGSTAGLKPSQGLDQQGLGINETDDRFGGALAVGDFNKDGFDDLAVGAPGETLGSAKSGFAFIYKGSTTGLKTLQSLDQQGLGVNESDDRFGTTLAVGDFNKDGFDDLAVGAPGEAVGSGPKSGFAFIYKGSTTGLKTLQGLDQKGLGVNELDDQFGAALAVGDFNNDGFDDLVVGAPGESPGSGPKSGFVFVYKGSATGLKTSQGLDQKGLGVNEAGDLFGSALTVLDFNNDGFDDLVVGAPGETVGSVKSGFAFIFKGSATGLKPFVGLDQKGLGANELGDLFGAVLPH